MAATATLLKLEGLKAVVETNGETLFVSPPEVLTDELRAAIRANKAQLIKMIEQRDGATLHIARAPNDALGARIQTVFNSTYSQQEAVEYNRVVSMLDSGQDPQEITP